VNPNGRSWKDRSASILDDARNLWKKVSSRETRIAAAASLDVEALGRQVRILEEEAGASFDVVRSIAQQHSGLSEQHMQLVQAVEELQARNRALAWVCALLAILSLAGLVLAIVK